MKRVKILVLIILGFFLSITQVNAETLNRNAVSNGKVELSITSNQGYVGALDATIKITGEVSLSKIDWDSSLSNVAMKEYNYDQNKNTVRILLVTKNKEQNLLDEHGNLKIGILEFTGKETTKYHMELTNLSVTNFDLKKTDIDQEHLLATGEESFIIEIESKTEPTPSPTAPTTTPNIEEDKLNDNKESANNVETNKTQSNETSINKDNMETSSEEKNEKDEINDVESNKKEDSQTQSHSTEKKESNSLISTIAIVIGIILVISMIAWFVTKKR